jgi:deoxyribodipyrimidine photo-lyase
MQQKPIILWLRRDLRLSDHPALTAALSLGRPVIPVFIDDPETQSLGTAPRWRLGLSVASLGRDLAARGSRLILRRGPALAVLRALIAETGADTLHWSRLYDPQSIARDTEVKAALKAEGLTVQSHPGHLLFEPWTVETGQGGPYRVYTPYWRSVRNRPVAPALPAPARIPVPGVWPDSDILDAWQMGAAMRRGAAVVARHVGVGEAVAQTRLRDFLDGPVLTYKEDRDRPDLPATSRLSENLTYGEISPRQIWHAGWRVLHETNSGSAEHFLKELVWREFSWHLLHHFPQLPQANWRAEWDAFPWRGESTDLTAWQRGMTGEPFVDAAMRELYVTGTMHNRARMITASYLTKHLLTDWRLGLAWFEDCLIDWDPAANAMGWQWVAGSGPDAAPYVRVFNPAGQAEKFDRAGQYRRRFIAEGQRHPPQDALDFFAACPKSWALAPGQTYPRPLVELAEGRARALDAYQRGKKSPQAE